MACSCNSNTCSSCGQSSNHHGHVFDHQTMFFFGLFSKSKDRSYVFENTWPDLHSPHQLDTNDIMFSCYHWISRDRTLGQCSRYLFIANTFYHLFLELNDLSVCLFIIQGWQLLPLC